MLDGTAFFAAGAARHAHTLFSLLLFFCLQGVIQCRVIRCAMEEVDKVSTAQRGKGKRFHSDVYVYA